MDCTVDVGEITTDEAIRVWPNPASKSLTISNLGLKMPTQIVIYDAQGSLHWSGSATRETTIDIEFWSPGLYIAILHNANPLRNTQAPTTLKLLVQ
ncbi:MAG: T9SS type A sorting domain-containing protein [Flavobacteriales bacterium]